MTCPKKMYTGHFAPTLICSFHDNNLDTPNCPYILYNINNDILVNEMHIFRE